MPVKHVTPKIKEYIDDLFKDILDKKDKESNQKFCHAVMGLSEKGYYVLDYTLAYAQLAKKYKGGVSDVLVTNYAKQKTIV